MTSRPVTGVSLESSPWEALARPRIFGLGAGVVTAAALLFTRDVSEIPGFLIIAASALLPALLWCLRATHGLPIYPVFALGTLWTFGFPFLSGTQLANQYGSGAMLAAAAAVTTCNLCGCGIWFVLTRRSAAFPGTYFGIHSQLSNRLFFTALLVAMGFNILTSSVDLELDPALFSILRAIIQALSNLAIFTLGHRAGRGELSTRGTQGYALVVTALLVSNLPSVLLVNALSDGALALIGFALGRGRLPGVALAAFVATTLFLQSGKAAVREKYWAEAEGAPISIEHVLTFLSDWLSFSWTQIFSTQPVPAVSTGGSDPAEPQSLSDRASLLPLFLLIQKMSPAEVPYLEGETYTIIPRLLVPRLLDEGKARSHLGTYILAMDYGLQRPEDTSMTTIGFGLLNEAMANFGYAGCAGLGLLLGAFYGGVGRWSSAHPLLSFRAMFAVLVLTVAFQNEYTAGVYVSVLFQGACALLLFSLLTMRRLVATEPTTEPRISRSRDPGALLEPTPGLAAP